MFRLSLVIKAVDQATAPIRKITAATKNLASNGLRKIAGEGTVAGRALDRIRSVAARVPAPVARATAACARFAGRAGLRGIERAGYATGYAIGFTIRKLASLTVTAAKWGGGAALAGGAAFIGSIIPLASKFEQFQVVLENTEGSANGARKAMAWVKDFGKTTPYEVEEVMEAFVALKAFGIDPMNGSLRSLGNAASGMGKPLMQAVEMMADAATGEFERLKEFGVKAKVAGDKVTFAYMRNGKAMTRSAKNSGAEIQAALLGIFDERFKGMMDRQSQTLSGIWSNIKDQIANFQLNVADAGFFVFVKEQLQRVLDLVNKLAKEGTLQRWAEQLSKWLEEAGTKALQFFQEQDWDAHGRTLLGVGRAVWVVAKAIGGLANAIAEVGGGIISFFQKWNELNNRAGQAIGVPNRPGGIFSRPPPQPRSSGRRLPNSPTGGRTLPPIAWPSRGPLLPGAARPNITWPSGGVSQSKVSLQISADPGVKTRVTDMRAAPGTQLDVSRGRVGMVG